MVSSQVSFATRPPASRRLPVLVELLLGRHAAGGGAGAGTRPDRRGMVSSQVSFATRPPASRRLPVLVELLLGR
ncbi:hypothetical protein CNY89_29425, partial [Amaricoccus sp. HAR-UPW-R2A-40]